MTKGKPVGRVTRIVEVLLGLVLLSGALLLCAGLITGIYVAATQGVTWMTALMSAAFFAVTCLAYSLGWRLLLGRPRAGGWWEHPWMLYAEAAILTFYGTANRMRHGPPYGDAEHKAAAEALRRARSRRRAAEPRSDS